MTAPMTDTTTPPLDLPGADELARARRDLDAHAMPSATWIETYAGRLLAAASALPDAIERAEAVDRERDRERACLVELLWAADKTEVAHLKGEKPTEREQDRLDAAMQNALHVLNTDRPTPPILSGELDAAIERAGRAEADIETVERRYCQWLDLKTSALRTAEAGIAALTAERDRLVAALEHGVAWFTEYGDHHAGKTPPDTDKAKRNYHRAAVLRAALANEAPGGETPDDDVLAGSEVEGTVEHYAQGYDFRHDDGTGYTPTAAERVMLVDFGHGLLEYLEESAATPSPAAVDGAGAGHAVGSHVRKVGGDYSFEGHVVAAFLKLNGRSRRYVVEDDRGILHIYSDKNLEAVAPSGDAGPTADPWPAVEEPIGDEGAARVRAPASQEAASATGNEAARTAPSPSPAAEGVNALPADWLAVELAAIDDAAARWPQGVKESYAATLGIGPDPRDARLAALEAALGQAREATERQMLEARLASFIGTLENIRDRTAWAEAVPQAERNSAQQVMAGVHKLALLALSNWRTP